MTALGAHALSGTAPAGDPASPVHRLDARAKLVGLIGVTVVAVSCAPGDWPVLAACAGALAAVAAVARVPARELWRRGRVVLLPVALVAALLPLVRADGGALAATVATKAAIGVGAAVLLTATTPFPAALRGLEALRVPPLLVQIAAFMYRYLFVLAGEGARMRQALAARGHRPGHALKTGALGRVATALFLRAFQRAERVHRAMLARGYAGTMPRAGSPAFGAADAAFAVLLVVPLLALRIAVELTP